VPETQAPLPAQPCPPHCAYLGSDPASGADVGASGAGKVTNVVCGSAGVPGSCGAGSSEGVPPSAGLPNGRAFSPNKIILVGCNVNMESW